MSAAASESASAAQRIDKWLWCARLVKTRTLAGKLVEHGGVRITRLGTTTRVAKASALVRPGDQLALAVDGRLKIVKVSACGDRRGPASEAQTLYDDLTPAAASSVSTERRHGGRPTKSDRRAIDRLHRGD